MRKNEVISRIREIIAKELNADLTGIGNGDILLEKSIDINSLSLIRVFLALEEELNFEFDDVELNFSSITSINDLIDRVLRHVSYQTDEL